MLWFIRGTTCSAVALLVGLFPDAEAGQWPQKVLTKEAKIVMYQPQTDSYKSNKVTARAALSVTGKDEQQPVFGVT
jgi:hypothetical protein